jgi:ABC-type multidrug transport system fused ATPase/permease subunit
MAHDFITGLPSGYDTEIGEGGHILSQGQKQRIAIARALIMNPRILIIDEGMAAVDSECEYRILRNLKDSGHNRLTILISHRLSTVRLSDRILVFEGGMIAEEGTHCTLVEKGGIYNRLFSGQFSTEDFMEKDSVAERMYSAI